MEALLTTISIILFILAAMTGLYWSFAIIKIVRSVGSVPTARAGLTIAAPEGGWPSVCVVIPAHNEQDVIGDLVTSLLAQDYPNLRLVFALDRCTDETERIIRELCWNNDRVEIAIIDECPDDWAGKTHAAHCGVTRSQAGKDAELLLFADADTIFDPGCVRACVGLLLQRDVDLLSLLSTLRCEHWWEQVAQPVAAFELLRHFPIASVNRKDNGRAFANGQFMLFRRDAYERIGGHESVKSELLEDIALARALRKSQRRTGEGRGIALLVADGMLLCRMYATWEAFRRGWKRIYTEASTRQSRRLRRWSTQLLLMSGVGPATLPFAIVFGGADLFHGDPTIMEWMMFALALAALFITAVAIAAIHRLQRAALWSVLTHPFGAWLVSAIEREAAADLANRRAIEWGGRAYVRDEVAPDRAPQ
ncbi:MAG: glycosyltransferase [Planctomycetota bacterium]|nr:glycosyltransferase [Planctomycetota bacterium]